jgi:carboxymethylenebutenolidase
MSGSLEIRRRANRGRMKITTGHVDLAGVRCLVAKPAQTSAMGRFPAIIAYSDIFQLTPPHVRIVQRLAGYGFVVVAPEIYTRIEPAGTVLDFENDRARALADAEKVVLTDLDRDVRAVMDAVAQRSDVEHTKIGVIGWCFGGHVAFRAARSPEIRATACCYATGIHSGELGGSSDTGSLERAHEIRGELLLVWGRDDPHTPADGRARIHRHLDDAGVRFEARLYDAEHTFMRDEGERFDPESADRAFRAVLGLFRRM